MTLWVVEAGEVFPAEGCALAGAFGAAHSPPAPVFSHRGDGYPCRKQSAVDIFWSRA